MEKTLDRRDQTGFTFIELLTVISIIGLLSTVGAVSYDSARRYSRDVKRVADMNTTQTGLELYYDAHLSYPSDGAKGPAGVVLGSGQALTLSDAGFAPIPEGAIYMVRVPENPTPGGIPFILRSVNADGSDCDKARCPNYQIVFATEGEVAGLDPGVHVLTQGGVTRAPKAPLGTLPTVSGGFASIVLGGATQAAFVFRDTAVDTLANPAVKAGLQEVVAPVATAGLVGVVVTAAPVAALPRYFLFFFSQPFLYLTRRRKEAFGVVYDAFSKLPVDLAIVRVRDARTSAVVRSSVTDAAGRFVFIMKPGIYRLEIAKPGYRFPTLALRGASTDGDYLDLYLGGDVKIERDGTPLTMSVPIEPVEREVSDVMAVRHESIERLRKALALSGPILAGASFAAVPTLWMGGLAVLHVCLYFVFRRVSIPARSKDHGVVHEEGTDQPIPQAVVRMFALPYHKLVATAVTDTAGRYGLLVGPAEVYVTVTKDGYEKTTTDAVDLRAEHGTMTIATDLPMRRVDR